MLTPPRRALIILNPGSGRGEAAELETTIRDRLGQGGVEAVIHHLRNGLDVDALVADGIRDGATVVVAGGGDGTVNAVANALQPHDVPMAVLPLGTLNHFARDLNLPSELEPAIDAILGGRTLRVDVAEVNGRVFLNNSSVGLYPRIVQLRERYRGRRALKWPLAAWATWRVTRQPRVMRVQLRADDVEVTRSTPLLFVGNNRYRMHGIDAGARTSLQAGELGVYVVKTAGRWNLLRLIWRIVTGTARESGMLAMLATTAAVIDLPVAAAPDRLDVATDGEVVSLALPLTYRTRPGALEVCVPA